MTPPPLRNPSPHHGGAIPGGRSAGHKYDGEVPGQGKVQGINRARTGGYYDEALMPTTRNKRDVWHINTVP